MSQPSITLKPGDFSDLAYVNGLPKFKGKFKTVPEDFKVVEQIAYELSGEGEHLWCWVEKRGENTDWVAGRLANWAGTSKANVGFAGQKDRQAVTQQWFSIQLPGKADPDPQDLNIEGVKILKMVRHNRKLQRGGLAGNYFELLIRDLQPMSEDGAFDLDVMKAELDLHLQQIAKQGVPNYFGEQRFGHNANNLREGEKLLVAEHRNNASGKGRGKNRRGGNRNQQSLYISALRSWMFNALLSERIQQQVWNRVLPGDIVQLTGSNKWFIADEQQDLAELQQRLVDGDLSPTGGLFGDGVLPTQTEALEIENKIVKSYQAWCDGLAKNRVKQDRRALILKPEGLQWSFEDSEQQTTGLSVADELPGFNQSEANRSVCNLRLSFTLPAGSFATMVLREILQVKTMKFNAIDA